MSLVWRWLKRLFLAAGVFLILLITPPIYVEIGCQGHAIDREAPEPLIDPEWQRPESRTLLTYPEWHIVHAYDDYAAVIATGDPHDFEYLTAIAGFWGALCPLTEAAAGMGGVDGTTKTTIYTIGVSFTAELLAKAAYEETLGRLSVLIRGSKRSPLDDLSAAQGAAYAEFLQQTPWYEWDFSADVVALNNHSSDSLRDFERRFALGTEFRAKSVYAGVIEAAVAEVGADQLKLRTVVSNISEEDLEGVGGVKVIGALGEGLQIETERYRAYTGILQSLAIAGADIVEIAGNDEILFTVTSDSKYMEGALYSFQRQGYGDYRHLIVSPVRDLANRLRGLSGVSVEHVHDY